MTDRYTDELFALPASLATTVAFPVSRLVVDPERFTDDESEPMARKGMGAVYERTAAGHPLRRPPSARQRQRLLALFYERHHAALTASVDDALATHGTCLLIDGHSFPTRPLPYEDDQDPDRPDICIGTDSRHTPTWLRDSAVHVFEALGWSVAVDRPFAGALVPMRFYQRDLRVHAVMIEVRRRLYMDEWSGVRLPRFDEVREHIHGALRSLCAWPEEPHRAGGLRPRRNPRDNGKDRKRESSGRVRSS
jgi:N-formylglutamate deformylase